MVRGWLAALVLAAGCEILAAPEPVIYDAAESACLFADEAQSIEDLVFKADAPAWIRVSFGWIGACDTIEEASCTATLDGDALVVEASAVVIPPDPGTDCVAMAMELAATCETPALPAGTWTLTHDGAELAVEVPGEYGSPPCVMPPVAYER